MNTTYLPKDVYLTQAYLIGGLEPEDRRSDNNPLASVIKDIFYEERPSEELEIDYINTYTEGLYIEYYDVEANKNSWAEANWSEEVAGIFTSVTYGFDVLPCHIRLIGDTYHFVEYLSKNEL